MLLDTFVVEVLAAVVDVLVALAAGLVGVVVAQVVVEVLVAVVVGLGAVTDCGSSLVLEAVHSYSTFPLLKM